MILHFGDKEFEVVSFRGEAAKLMMDITAPMNFDVPPSVLKLRKKIRQMMEERKVRVIYQPIVSLDGEETLAHEILGRGDLEGLPSSPAELLRLAGSVGQAIPLSRLMNDVGVEQFGEPGRLFINVHPDELGGLGFISHLVRLRQRASDVELVVEVPETAITGPGQLRELEDNLKDANIKPGFRRFRSRSLAPARDHQLATPVHQVRPLDDPGPDRGRGHPQAGPRPDRHHPRPRCGVDCGRCGNRRRRRSVL